ncbi:MAG: TolC family protein [Trichloromonadaceae bacterium]
MSKPIIALTLLTALSLCPWQAKADPLTLTDVVRLGLERNLNLRAQMFETRASEALVHKGYGIYDPVAEAALAAGTSRRPDGRTPSNTIGITDYRRFDLGLSQLLPSGARLEAAFTNQREDNSLVTGVNPAYQSELRFSLVQPLLRDFGVTVTERGILFALEDRNISVQDLRERAFAVVSDARKGFYGVLRLRDNLAYRETSVALAEKVLVENRARVEAGVLAPVETLEAEVGLQTRQRELLDANRNYEDALDQLALLLAMPDGLRVADVPLGQPELATDEVEAMQTALVARPDLLRRASEIVRLGVERQVAHNQLLPTLDLTGSYSHRGLGESYSEDIEDVRDGDLNSWELGLRLSYPLGNREARNEYLRSEQRLKGRHAQQAQLREEVRTEIRSAIRLLEVSRKKIEVTSKGRALAEEKLRTLLKRKEVGLATTRQVLEGEEDLALARIDHTAALTDYNNAVTDYLRVSGQLLQAEGVRFVESLAARGEGPLLEAPLQ